MAALKSAAVALLLAPMLAWATPAAADPLDRWSPQITEAAARFGVPAAWIRRVMRAESGGRTTLNGRPIVSRAGAMGLMQLMPATWRDMRARVGLGRDPHDPRDNILAGTAYLRLMYDRFGYPGLFAAYNAGPARYARHLATGRPLPGETVAYLAAVTGAPARRAANRSTPARSLFAAPARAGSAAIEGGPDADAGAGVGATGLEPAAGSLFVPLRHAGPR
jgi:soluble lytic murein transglycosylase-like protein